MEVIEVAGVPVTIVRKAIKNLHLYVKPSNGRVEVSVPEGFSDESVHLFVLRHKEEIRCKREAFQKAKRLAEREYVSGESFFVWGKQYYLRVTHEGGKNSLRLQGEYAILNVGAQSTIKSRTEWVTEWYRDEMKARVATLLPKWEARTGLYSTGWQCKIMHTQWGSCMPKSGKIWLNLQLAKKPVACLEYVLLHELAHLRDRTHGSLFESILDAHMPFWRDIRKQLNDLPLDFVPAYEEEAAEKKAP